MLNTILKALTSFGGEFQRTNQKTGTGTITSYENSELQVRETRPNRGAPGIRISVQGPHLRTLATSDGGLDKLRYHVRVADAVKKVIGPNMEVSYREQPNKAGRAYPVIWVNQKVAPAVDVAELVTKAKEAGVDVNKIMAAVEESAWDKLTGYIALADAGVDDSDQDNHDDPPDLDDDGDSFPA